MKSIVVLYRQADSRAFNFETQNEPMRGVDFNPLSAATVFHLPVRVSSTVKSLFSLSLSLWPFQVQRNSVSIPISASCHRPVYPQSTHVSNILNHTDVSSLEVVSIIRYLTVARHWLPSPDDFARELQLNVFPFRYSLTYRENREGIGTLFLPHRCLPVSFVSITYTPLGATRIYGRKFKRGELSWTFLFEEDWTFYAISYESK